MKQKYEKCFVTVGTTRFDLLIQYMFNTSILNALKAIGCKEITLQIGKSNTEPELYDIEGIHMNLYRFKDSLQEDIEKADLIISHAGAGSCIEALEAGKPLLVVVNENLMDNHQLELAEQLQNDGHLYYCTCDTLETTLQEVDFSMLKPFPKANPKVFIKYLDKVIRVQE